MRRRLQIWAQLYLIALTAQASAGGPAKTCPVTRITPANGVDIELMPGLWLGSKNFAAAIPPGGRWQGMGPDRGYSGKLYFYAKGFEPTQISQFTLVGTNLDNPDQQSIQFKSTNARFEGSDTWLILAGLAFPKPGCWEMLAHYENRTLAFTLWVR